MAAAAAGARRPARRARAPGAGRRRAGRALSLETIALGLLSGVRPATSQAAVVALLRSAAPRRTLTVFAIAGWVVSVAIGLLVVALLQGAGNAVGRRSLHDGLDLAAGLAALAFAAAYRSGRIVLRPRPGGRGAAAGPAARIATRLRDPSPRAAAAAGVATHVPGLIYLVALEAIAAGHPAPLDAAVQVAVYNLLWFAIPLAALAVTIFSPERAQEMLGRGTAWAQRHQDALITGLFAGLGTYLTIRAVVGLT
ncbi:MAG: GAP family protein [Solirubrobacteraceae bacterium]